jgi:cellulose synthase/poly-beta-1,6-N-acetylglucosamine synthase-like glycosyltransferase
MTKYFLLLFFSSWGLIFYTYAFFPVLIYFFSIFHPRNQKSNNQLQVSEILDSPIVAIVVAAFNEEFSLEDKLQNSWRLDYPSDRLRLFIGSDGSTDRTGEILNDCFDTRLTKFLFLERRGKISVLNELMEHLATTETEIVVFSDANTMLAPDSIQKLVAHFRDPQVGCVSGELRLENKGGVSGEGFYWRYENWIKRSESRLGFLIGCNGGIFAIRREVFEALPPSTIIEDFVLTLRILERGWKVVFEPAAIGVEPPCPSSHAEMVRKIRIGAGNFQALALTWRVLLPSYGLSSFAYWGHKVIRWFVPIFLLLAFVSNFFLLNVFLYRVLLLLQLSGFAVAAWSYRSVEEKPAPKIIRLIGYFYLMNYAIFCGFLRFLRRNQRVTWERASR